MKIAIRTVFSLLVVGALAFAGCNKYDDSALTDRVDDLENRVTELEKLVADLQTNVNSVSKAVKALEDGDRIVSVTPFNDNTGSGFIVEFSKSGSMKVFNGEKPVVGVEQGEDGVYYWTVDGDPMMDNGQKVPATKTPEFKAEEGKLYFRINGGEWTLVEGADQGIGIISKIEQTDNDVTFYLSEGGNIVIPKVQSFGLEFEFSEYGAVAGQPMNISYSVTEGDENTIVKAIPDPGFTVTPLVNHGGAGSFSITPPETGMENGSVLIVALKGKAITGKLLTFADGQFNIKNSDKTAKIAKAGGEVALLLETNLPYMLIPKPEVTWVRQKQGPSTKALRQDEIVFEVDPNDGAQERQVTFTIKYGYRYETETMFTIIQTTGGEADFATFNKTSTLTKYVESDAVTASGWNVNEYCSIITNDLAKWDEVNGNMVYLCSVKGELGELYSPTLKGGCGKLTIKHGSTVSASQLIGYEFEVLVTNSSGNTVKSFTVGKAKEELTAREVYIVTSDINVSGDFKITLKNTGKYSSTSSMQKGKGGAGILSVEWTGYTE